MRAFVKLNNKLDALTYEDKNDLYLNDINIKI